MALTVLAAFCQRNEDRLSQLSDELASYQPLHIDALRIRSWLGQFDPEDYDLVLRILENVQFYSLPRLHGLLRTLHRNLRIVLAEDGFRKNDDIIFVPMGKTGESGQEIVNRYRNVNGLGRSRAGFAQVVELVEVLYEADSTGTAKAVVFLDDFIGTGKQASDFWAEVLSQQIPPGHPVYLGTVVACRAGLETVERHTPFHVVPVHIVQPRHIFLESDLFRQAEKDRIVARYNAIGNPTLGIGGLGVLVAFAHGSPNNTLAILRGSKGQRHWRGILPRFDDLGRG